MEQRATLTRGVLLIAPFRFVATSAHTQLHLPKPPATIPASFKGQRSAFPNGARAVYNITPIRAEFHTGTSSMMLRRYNLNTCLENHTRANKALQREPRPQGLLGSNHIAEFAESGTSLHDVLHVGAALLAITFSSPSSPTTRRARLWPEPHTATELLRFTPACCPIHYLRRCEETCVTVSRERRDSLTSTSGEWCVCCF